MNAASGEAAGLLETSHECLSIERRELALMPRVLGQGFRRFAARSADEQLMGDDPIVVERDDGLAQDGE